jgi:hypothetical protein
LEDSSIPTALLEEVVHAPEDGNSDERGYPWSSDATDPRKEPPYTLLVHFDRTYAGGMEGLSENDLHNALDDVADRTIPNGVVYSDVEGQRQNPEPKMVTALLTNHIKTQPM